MSRIQKPVQFSYTFYSKESGEHVLKNMDNEEYFPSLGGSKPAKKGHITPGAAWGKVDPVVQKELEEKEKSTTPIYLNGKLCFESAISLNLILS